MAQVSSHIHTLRPITPRTIPLNGPKLSPSRIPPPLLPSASYKAGHMNLDTFSPVDENGSFRFDRVIKSGKVTRRTKKKRAWKPSWKPMYLVLRPNLLSVYQSEDETGLRDSITLSEITAVASVKKTNTEHVFGVFTPVKNFHFACSSEADATDWIHRLRVEAGTEDQEEWQLPPLQPGQAGATADGFESTDLSGDESPNPPGSPEFRGSKVQGRPMFSQLRSTSRQTATLGEPSNNEISNLSQSDFSDTPVGSLPKSVAGSAPKHYALSPIVSAHTPSHHSPQNASQQSIGGAVQPSPDPERVIWQGWLLVLKTKGGVKQWKSTWAVLRAKNLSFYKTEQEYAAIKLLQMDSVINAAEIEPLSKSKQFCFQIIIEDKTYKLCAMNEEGLAKWLGAIKSVLSKRRERVKSKPPAIHEGMAGLKVT